MAHNTHLTAARWDAALDAALDVLNGGTVKIYDGTQPATPETAVTTQHLLATITLPNPAFGASSGGTKTAASISSVTAPSTAGHTATWYRAATSGGTAVLDGTAGASGTDMVLTNAALIGVGDTVAVASWSVVMPTGQ